MLKLAHTTMLVLTGDFLVLKDFLEFRPQTALELAPSFFIILDINILDINIRNGTLEKLGGTPLLGLLSGERGDILDWVLPQTGDNLQLMDGGGFRCLLEHFCDIFLCYLGCDINTNLNDHPVKGY